MPVIPPTSPRVLGGPTLSRRRALQLLAGTILATTFGGAGCSDDGDGTAEAADHWAAVAAAARRDEPELDAEVAAAELGRDVGPTEARRPAGAWRAELTERIRADYGAGRTQLVDGWLLSRTEVLLAVVASEADS